MLVALSTLYTPATLCLFIILPKVIQVVVPILGEFTRTRLSMAPTPVAVPCTVNNLSLVTPFVPVVEEMVPVIVLLTLLGKVVKVLRFNRMIRPLPSPSNLVNEGTQDPLFTPINA